MKSFHILIAGTAATGLMSLFSYWYSRKEKEQFREPQLLGQLMSPEGASESLSPATRGAGWAGHVATGILLTGMYWSFWDRYKIRPGVLHGVILGGMTGLMATRVWKLVFKLHPHPPRIDYKEYYQQLVAAHVIFGLTDVVVYRMTSSRHLRTAYLLNPSSLPAAGRSERIVP